MANLKGIRDRIKSVSNTRKITEAMRLVAAARVRRAQDQVNATRPFADRLAQVFFRLQSRLRLEDANLPLLRDRPVKKVGILVVSGDRGLCGAYNSNILKKAEERAQELKAQGIEIEYYLVGRKAAQYFQRRKAPIAQVFNDIMKQIPAAPQAAMIADAVLAAFLSESVDRIEVIYTRFVSLISSRPVLQTLLPLNPKTLADADDEVFRLLVRGGDFTVERTKVEAELVAAPQDMIFEQDPVQILDALLPLYLNNQLLRGLQESAASELAARMTAMNNASDNASELIKTLTLVYNKARQAAITQEIIEVVSGSLT
ncbi:MAG: F0F1 ATP synthase subunit gamma [Synechococcales cyanobacterium]